MKILQFIGILVCMTLLTGCSNLNRTFSNFFFPPNFNSDIRADEKTHLKVAHFIDRDTINKTHYEPIFSQGKLVPPGKEIPPTRFSPLGLAAPAVAGFVIDQVESFLKKEAERYTAAYSAVTVDDVFYQSPHKFAPINVKGFEFIRKAGKATKNNDGKEYQTTAMRLCAAVRPTVDQRGFEIFIPRPELGKSKAKLIAFDFLAPLGFDLLAPWTIFKSDGKWTSYDNTVDVTAQIFIYAVWTDLNGSPHTEQMVSKEVIFRNVELQDKEPQGECDYETIKTHATTTQEDYKQLLFNAIPRNYLGQNSAKNQDGIFGAGNYILAVLITEHDDFGEHVRELGQNVKENREALVNRLTEGL